MRGGAGASTESSEFAISGPQGFRRAVHVGWDEERGWEAQNVPQEWKKLFASVGVSETASPSSPKSGTPAVSSPAAAASAPAAVFRGSGPLASAAVWRATFEQASSRAAEAAKQEARAEKMHRHSEKDVAAALREVERKKAVVAEAERKLEEERADLKRLEGLVEDAQAITDDLAEKARKAKVETERTARAERDARAELERTGKREAELSRLIGRCRVAYLSAADVGDVLRDLGLAQHAAAFEVSRVDGAVLARMDDEQMRSLGLRSFAERKRLRHAMHTVAACGQLLVTRAAIEGFASGSSTPSSSSRARQQRSPKKEEVATWLRAQEVAPENVAAITRAGVTGEQLMQVDEVDLAEEFAMDDESDRRALLESTTALRSSYFLALSECFSAVMHDNDRAERRTPRERESEDKGPPREYLCPITLELMSDPVVATDGFIYEGSAIKRWLRTNSTSPMTGAPMDPAPLIPCKTLRSAILEFKERQDAERAKSRPRAKENEHRRSAHGSRSSHSRR
eukprot:m51a1_g12334 hypothetical protein (514) ;mRNA; r:489056-490673